MRKSRKINRKRSKSKKCVYTDEAKQILKAIKELRKINKTRKNKTT